jgi:hypothetical protein
MPALEVEVELQNLNMPFSDNVPGPVAPMACSIDRGLTRSRKPGFVVEPAFYFEGQAHFQKPWGSLDHIKDSFGCDVGTKFHSTVGGLYRDNARISYGIGRRCYPCCWMGGSRALAMESEGLCCFIHNCCLCALTGPYCAPYCNLPVSLLPNILLSAHAHAHAHIFTAPTAFPSFLCVYGLVQHYYVKLDEEKVGMYEPPGPCDDG